MADEDTISGEDAVAANVAIIKAFGFDPHQVKTFTIELDRMLGPLVTAEFYTFDENGNVAAKRQFTEDGDAVTVLKRFKLTEQT